VLQNKTTKNDNILLIHRMAV